MNFKNGLLKISPILLTKGNIGRMPGYAPDIPQ